MPPRNVEELAKALEKLLADKPLRTRLGEAARQRALTLFDARKVNRQVVDEYRILLQEKKIIE